MSWWQTVVAELCEYKRTGWTFDAAWAEVIAARQPRRRDLGLLGVAELLFEDAAWSEAVAWYRGVAADAWFGRRPGLRHFEPTLLAA